MSLSWSLVSSPSSVETSARAMCWSPDLARFVAFGDIAMYSDDGLNWLAGNAPDYHAVTNFVSMNGIIWNVNLQLFIAICNANSPSFDTILTSPDGINWTTRTSPIDLQKGIAYEPVTGFTIIVGNDGAWTGSVDGITWDDAGTAGSDLVSVDATADWTDVVWVPDASQFVAVASNGNIRIATSPDGLAWTGRHGFDPTYQTTWRCIAVKLADDVLIACAGANGRRIMRSVDGGTTWETPYSIAGLGAFGVECYTVIWSETLSCFIAIIINGNDVQGQVYTNTTGAEADWVLDSIVPDTVVTSGGEFDWETIVEAPSLDRFVAGQGNFSEEPFATSGEGGFEIIGDIDLGIQDAGIFTTPNEIIGDINLGITIGNVNEIVGNISLGIEVDPATVYSADSSGIYEIIPLKRNDTLYLRDAEDDSDVETVDVAIPRPFGKTGFVGG